MTKTSSRFGNVNAARGDEVVVVVVVAVEAIGAVMISREEPGNQDLRHLGVEAHVEAHVDDPTIAPRP